MNLKIHLCIGGTDVRDDIDSLKNGVHIVVGTPGRISDMLRQKKMRFDDLKIFVIDEADEMLSTGFAEQVKEMYVPRQNLFKFVYFQQHIRKL